MSKQAETRKLETAAAIRKIAMLTATLCKGKKRGEALAHLRKLDLAS